MFVAVGAIAMIRHFATPSGTRADIRVSSTIVPDVATLIRATLATEANAEVGAIHPKAMPTILRTEDELETWMTAPADEALKLQRPLPDGGLQVVMTGEKEDVA